MCTYYTERKERGEGGRRGKKGIYIYMIYRVDPFLSAGVVSMRQLALLYMLVHSLHALIRARTHIYTSVEDQPTHTNLTHIYESKTRAQSMLTVNTGF